MAGTRNLERCRRAGSRRWCRALGRTGNGAGPVGLPTIWRRLRGAQLDEQRFILVEMHRAMSAVRAVPLQWTALAVSLVEDRDTALRDVGDVAGRTGDDAGV